jgi:hypothetical protein
MIEALVFILAAALMIVVLALAREVGLRRALERLLHVLLRRLKILRREHDQLQSNKLEEPSDGAPRRRARLP